MGISPQWDNGAKTVILAAIEDEWNWDDAYAIIRQINQMIESVNHRVDLIFGDRTPHKGRIPPNAVTHWHNAYRSLPPNAGLIVIVGGDPFVRALLNAVIKLARASHRIQMVSTLEEARALVRHRQVVGKSA